MKYAYILNADESIVKHEDYDNFDAASVAHKYGPDKAQRIIPVVKLDDPTISDPLTERFGARIVTVEADRVTWQRGIEAISQEEQDDAAERQTIKGWHQRFKDGTATNLQAQRAIARLIKETYGD